MKQLAFYTAIGAIKGRENFHKYTTVQSADRNTDFNEICPSLTPVSVNSNFNFEAHCPWPRTDKKISFSRVVRNMQRGN